MHTAPFDSHCHFEPTTDPQVLINAQEKPLAGLLAVGGSLPANEGALHAAERAPGFALPCIGFDYDETARLSSPEKIHDCVSKLRDDIATLAARGIRVAAIGEVGLDYARTELPEERALQRRIFLAQLELARELSLPCSIHTREAEEDTLAILRDFFPLSGPHASTIHCFVGPADFAERLCELNLYFGLSGILTFRNAAALRELVPSLPREKLLVETDSPFLAPVPLRGKPCEPAFVCHTLQCLATILGLSYEAATDLTTGNATRVYGHRGPYPR